MKKYCRLFIITGLICLSAKIMAQEGFDNRTRALWLFDIARYVDYGEALDTMALFRMGVLSRDSDLYYEMLDLARTRGEIQGKPVLVVVFRNEERIEYTNLLYVSPDDGFNTDKVMELIGTGKTLLVSEGSEFGRTMFNFIVVNGQPRFEINEDMLDRAGISVPTGVLVQAVKTREDWEALYSLTREELERQLELVEEQKQIIEQQKQEIERQQHLLDSLDAEIDDREMILRERESELIRKTAEVRSKSSEILRQVEVIDLQQAEVTAQRDTLQKQRNEIERQLTAIDEQLRLIDEQEERIMLQVEAIEKQKIVLWSALFLVVLLIFLAYYIYSNYRVKKEANVKLAAKNKTITEQNTEIERQRDLARSQRDQIAYQKKHITDSIMYARRIQTALLPSLELFSDEMEHFVLYKPLDIVSGDFYWVSSEGNVQIVIAADCTGHGVPGAFMSMLGVTMLKEIVNGKNIVTPDQILNNLRREIVDSLKQSVDDDRVKDGMDMAVIAIDYNTNCLRFAGANLPLCIVRNGELKTIKGDKMPVSIHFRMNDFVLHETELQKGDSIYMFSDGFGDQFGGPHQKKYMVRNLKERLIELSPLPMIQQGEKLSEIFEEWRGGTPQVDDVTVIGIRY
jgi:serine phosphatase RsbU (regulator of sigma subunit)